MGISPEFGPPFRTEVTRISGSSRHRSASQDQSQAKSQDGVTSVRLSGPRIFPRLGNPANLTVVETDARNVSLVSLVWPDVSFKVVGNLPYYAANPIVRSLLESRPQPRLIVVMLQQEVAKGMAAVPGEMTLLSVATQYYAVPRLVCNVPPRAFRPPPKVTSALLRLDIRDRPAVDVADPESFFALVRAGFSAPRKQLTNSLSHGLGVPSSAVKQVLDVLGLDGSRRPATLSLDDWAAIHHAWERTRGIESPRIR